MLRAEIVRDAEPLEALWPAWRALWRSTEARPPTLHPAWIEAWWSTVGGDGELCVVACREGSELVGVAPFYVRPPRGGALRVRELKLLGDGVVAPSEALLARAADEQAVALAVGDALAEERSWDLLDLSLVGGAATELLVLRLSERGRRVEKEKVAGRAAVELLGAAGDAAAAAAATSALPLRRTDASRVASLVSQLAELASRAPSSDAARAAEPAFVRFLERSLAALAEEGVAALWSLEESGRLVAGDLVLSDGERRIELLRGAAPALSLEGVTRAAVARAHESGARTFELAGEPPPVDDDPHAAPPVRVAGTRLRVYSATTTAALTAGYTTIEKHTASVKDVARSALSGVAEQVAEQSVRARKVAVDFAEVASATVERAVARVASFSKLHLYRGELFVRGAPPPPGVELRLFSLADFEALEPPSRELFLRRLDLTLGYCRQKWERGDLVVYATATDGEAGPPQPAGILWCARIPVFVPDIGREVRPLAGECYIHDVFVAPSARGTGVAPAMLEFLASDLRRRDIYRAWALIERANTASTRAFEKAAYASVADVIYARMGMASKLLVRPPDPEARKFLGLK